MLRFAIGNFVVLGAGSIVTKNIDDFTVVVGNHARTKCTSNELYKKRLHTKIDLTSEYDVEKMKKYFWNR